MYTAGALAGVAIGVALPLLIALGVMYYLLKKEQRRFSKPKLMYKLPDEVTREDFTFTPPPPLRTTTAFSEHRSSNVSRGTDVSSTRGSIRTMGTMSTHRPPAPPSFMERYEAMKKAASAQVEAKELGMLSPAARHELPSPGSEARYELSETRMSNASKK
jgi:hypothetical protein